MSGYGREPPVHSPDGISPNENNSSFPFHDWEEPLWDSLNDVYNNINLGEENSWSSICFPGEGNSLSYQTTNPLPPNEGEGNSQSFPMTNQLPPNGDHMQALDTHQEGQNSNPSNKNKPPRRKPKPFTVDEAEAFVQSVLRQSRPGRWTKIKNEDFRNSRRTATDLKDKWRNLEITAKLPAYKRRGDVLPEWLLESVRSICRELGNGKQIPPAS